MAAHDCFIKMLEMLAYAHSAMLLLCHHHAGYPGGWFHYRLIMCLSTMASSSVLTTFHSATGCLCGG